MPPKKNTPKITKPGTRRQVADSIKKICLPSKPSVPGRGRKRKSSVDEDVPFVLSTAVLDIIKEVRGKGNDHTKLSEFLDPSKEEMEGKRDEEKLAARHKELLDGQEEYNPPVRISETTKKPIREQSKFVCS